MSGRAKDRIIGPASSNRAAMPWEDVKMVLYEAGYRETQPGVFSREAEGRLVIVAPPADAIPNSAANWRDTDPPRNLTPHATRERGAER